MKSPLAYTKGQIPDLKTMGMTEDGSMMFIECTIMPEEVFQERVNKLIEEIRKPESADALAPFKVYLDRIEHYQLQDKLADDTIMGILTLMDGISFGTVVAYIILLLEASDNMDKKIEFKDIPQIFPLGFFTEESMIKIIDNLFKSGKHKYSYIYNFIRMPENISYKE